MTSALQRVKFTVAYDGTAFSGWQVQPRKTTVQSRIEAALAQVLQQDLRIHASGRTDTGVHARGQVFHCDISVRRDLAKLCYSLNALLSDDIRIMAASRVENTFHARFDAVKKEYRYFIHNAPVIEPFHRLYRLHLHQPLDVKRMQAAAALLVGEHDFASFSANPNREIDSTVRTLYTLAVTKNGPALCLRAVGSGFLYKMVRSLSGFLIDVGRGKLEPEVATAVLAQKSRTKLVRTARPEGLFLWRVSY